MADQRSDRSSELQSGDRWPITRLIDWPPNGAMKSALNFKANLL